jgi:hypothetical protein
MISVLSMSSSVSGTGCRAHHTHDVGRPVRCSGPATTDQLNVRCEIRRKGTGVQSTSGLGFYPGLDLAPVAVPKGEPEAFLAGGVQSKACLTSTGRVSSPRATKRCLGSCFVVSLKGLDEAQTTRIRDQAAAALERQEPAGRATVDERLQRPRPVGASFPTAGPNRYQVSIAADPTDPLSHIYDDRGRVIAVALANADDPDELVAGFWRRVAEGFDYLRLGKSDPM